MTNKRIISDEEMIDACFGFLEEARRTRPSWYINKDLAKEKVFTDGWIACWDIVKQKLYGEGPSLCYFDCMEDAMRFAERVDAIRNGAMTITIPSDDKINAFIERLSLTISEGDELWHDRINKALLAMLKQLKLMIK